MGKNVPYLPNIDAIIGMGINPETGLPYKLGKSNGLEYNMKPEIKKTLRIVDEQDAVNRFKWYNLPNGLNSQMIERILYYRGKAILFMLQDKWYFLPFALDGSIDVYGRFMGVTPVPFGGGSTNVDDEKKNKPWIQGLSRKPVYDVKLLEELTVDDLENSCVILEDYTPQLSQQVIPRAQLQEPYIEFMADMLPFCRTSLLNGTGVSAIRVNSEDEQSNVDAASRSVNRAALQGQKWIPIIGQIDFQDLTGGNVARAEDFLMSMQSVDNLRLSMYGLENGGLFQKKAHMLQDEQDMNSATVGLVLQDGLTNRQRFCDIVNSIWGLGIWCDIAEPAIGADLNGDLLAVDEVDQSGTQPTNDSPVMMNGGNDE